MVPHTGGHPGQLRGQKDSPMSGDGEDVFGTISDCLADLTLQGH